MHMHMHVYTYTRLVGAAEGIDIFQSACVYVRLVIARVWHIQGIVDALPTNSTATKRAQHMTILDSMFEEPASRWLVAFCESRDAHA